MSVALTVIVKDENGKLLNNADVTVAPGDFTAKTNENGEATLNIEGANRYQVTVSAGESEQTVPFYVVGNQTNARLDVNLQYFKQLNEVKGETTDVGSTPWYQTDVAYAGYAVAFVIVLAVIVKVVISKRKASRHVRTARATTTSQPTTTQESTAVEDVASELEKESKTAKTKKSKKSSK